MLLILPFLEFFIKQCSSNEAIYSIANYDESKEFFYSLKQSKKPLNGIEYPIDFQLVGFIAGLLSKQKDTIVTFKNSLLINTYFKNRFITK